MKMSSQSLYTKPSQPLAAESVYNSLKGTQQITDVKPPEPYS